MKRALVTGQFLMTNNARRRPGQGRLPQGVQESMATLTNQLWICASALSKLRARLALRTDIAKSIKYAPLYRDTHGQVVSRLPGRQRQSRMVYTQPSNAVKSCETYIIECHAKHRLIWSLQLVSERIS
jgi:hypothetical protein